MMDRQHHRDLESHFQDTLVLPKAYEDQLRLSGDPPEKRKVAWEIARLRQLLASCQVDLAALNRPGAASQVQIEFVNREAELHLLHVKRPRAARSPHTLASALASYGKAYLTATAFSSISI